MAQHTDLCALQFFVSREVEELITIPIEDAMGTLGKLKKMNSSSSRSNSSVSLEFQFGTDMDLMALEVRDRLDQVRAELPEDVRKDAHPQMADDRQAHNEVQRRL